MSVSPHYFSQCQLFASAKIQPYFANPGKQPTLADVQACVHDIAARRARIIRILRATTKEGAGDPQERAQATLRGRRECRVRGAPAARVRQKVHTVVTTGTPDTRHFPAQW